MEKFRSAIEEEEVKLPTDNYDFLAQISSQQAQQDTHHVS
jgi:hypothetical protein